MLEYPVGVFSDNHAPFSQEGAKEHCYTTFDTHNVKSIVHCGDLWDHHRISRHTTEPDAMGAVEEWEAAMLDIREWADYFPKMHIILGNHDLIPYRQAKEVGLPKTFLRDLQRVYKVGKGWEFYKKLFDNNILFLHDAGSGMYGAFNKARQMSCSVVAGHTHRFPGVIYFSNPLHLFFGMQLGCTADKEAYSMRYSNQEVTLGCGIIYGPSEAYYVPMDLGRVEQ